MCFSAAASFGTGVVLSLIGVKSIQSAKQKAHYFFACIPVLFAVQQFSEGFIWLYPTNLSTDFWSVFRVYFYLAFAQVIWPFYIPFSFYKLESNLLRKRFLYGFTIVGVFTSLLLLFRLVYYPVQVFTEGCHIDYMIGASKWLLVTTGLTYVLAIVVAPFFSSFRLTKWLAAFNVVSFVCTVFFFRQYLISVWCFFAAAQSIVVVLILRTDTNTTILAKK